VCRSLFKQLFAYALVAAAGGNPRAGIKVAAEMVERLDVELRAASMAVDGDKSPGVAEAGKGGDIVVDIAVAEP